MRRVGSIASCGTKEGNRTLVYSSVLLQKPGPTKHFVVEAGGVYRAKDLHRNDVRCTF